MSLFCNGDSDDSFNPIGTVNDSIKIVKERLAGRGVREESDRMLNVQAQKCRKVR